MKRIAMISEHASPLASPGLVDSGGQNVYVAQLARHLAVQGYLVDIFTRKDDATLPQIVNWLDGVRIINITAGPQSPIIKEEMLPHMREFEINMINFIISEHLHYSIVHANFFMSALVAMGIKKELDIPFVVTFHALGHVRMLHQAEADKFPSRRLTIEEDAVREADHIIAECPQDRDDLIEHYYAEANKITIIPCGFSSAEFYPIEKAVARRILKLPQNEHIILQLGRMVPRKGIDNVIRSLEHLKKLDKPVKLVIVGGDSEKMKDSSCPEFKRLADIAQQAGVNASVIFAGRKSRDQLKFYYAAADLFITTPWYEPFGITPLEAMACGTPVIGSDVGGIKYSVADGHTGALVPPRQPQALAEKIAGILSDEQLFNRMCDNAVRHVNTHFTWKKVAEQAGILYTSVAQTVRHSRLLERLGNNESFAA